MGTGTRSASPSRRRLRLGSSDRAGRRVDTLEAFAVIDAIRLAGVIRKPVYVPCCERWKRSATVAATSPIPRPYDTLLPFAWTGARVTPRGDPACGVTRSRPAGARSPGPAGRARLPELGRSSLPLLREVRRCVPRGGGGGAGQPPERIDVTTIVLVGSSNGGSMRILRELDRGRTYIPLIGRKWQPETLFTFPALYEDLPAYRRDLFVSAEGGPLDVDLYDAGAWSRYGWSAFGAAARRRLSRLDATSRIRYRGTAHRLPAVDARSGAALSTRTAGRRRLVAPTPISPHPGQERPSDTRTGGSASRRRCCRGRLSTPAGRRRPSGDSCSRATAAVDRDPRLRELAAAAGDGHATLESQQWLAARGDCPRSTAHPSTSPVSTSR